MKLKVILLGFLLTLLVLPHTLFAQVTTPTLTAQWVKGNPTVGDAQDNLTLRIYMEGDVAPTSDTVILAGFNLLIELNEEFVNENTTEADGGGDIFTNINILNPSDANVGTLSDNTTPNQLLNNFRLLQDAYPCATDAADRDIINAMRWDSGVKAAFPVSGAPAGKTWIGLTALYQTSVDLSGIGCGSSEENIYNTVTAVPAPAPQSEKAVVADITFILDGDAIGVESLEDFFENVVISNLPGSTTSFVFADIGTPGGDIPLTGIGAVGPEYLNFDDVILDEFTSVSNWLQLND
ncbi:MAG: hypothetical protein JJU11_07305 [Candidatus Sumerlaeia bacterium]|nr:hypothetical protein [Candidatus Sumerlaeia bacterium]